MMVSRGFSEGDFFPHDLSTCLRLTCVGLREGILGGVSIGTESDDEDY